VLLRRLWIPCASYTFCGRISRLLTSSTLISKHVPCANPRNTAKLTDPLTGIRTEPAMRSVVQFSDVVDSPFAASCCGSSRFDAEGPTSQHLVISPACSHSHRSLIGRTCCAITWAVACGSNEIRPRKSGLERYPFIALESTLLRLVFYSCGAMHVVRANHNNYRPNILFRGTARIGDLRKYCFMRVDSSSIGALHPCLRIRYQ
jgi:hypothetical protein